MAVQAQAQPEAFHVMAKPTGAQCNLDCAYCFFLKKEQLYADDIMTLMPRDEPQHTKR